MPRGDPADYMVALSVVVCLTSGSGTSNLGRFQLGAPRSDRPRASPERGATDALRRSRKHSHAVRVGRQGTQPWPWNCSVRSEAHARAARRRCSGAAALGRNPRRPRWRRGTWENDGAGGVRDTSSPSQARSVGRMSRRRAAIMPMRSLGSRRSRCSASSSPMSTEASAELGAPRLGPRRYGQQTLNPSDVSAGSSLAGQLTGLRWGPRPVKGWAARRGSPSTARVRV